MKKTLMYVAFAGILISCGSTKPVVQSYQAPQSLPQQSQSTNPFGGEFYTDPTFEPDTEEYFAASGIASGPRARIDVLQRGALVNAQNIILQKMQHAYEGMVSDYTNREGNNIGTDIANRIQDGGNHIIKTIVDETMARDVKYSGVDDKGYVKCFVGIRIYKKQAAEKIANQLSKDEKLNLRFDEEQYRKYIQEKFKEYKENQ